MKRRIVFITDCTDVAYSELRGTVLSAHPDLEIEPVVSVKSFSLINGSFVLRLMAEAYPEGTVFSVILNPMRERPARLIGRTKTKDFAFLGANTGVFNWFLEDFGVSELYEIHDKGFLPFGGKYVHAPAAAHVASGGSLELIGIKFDQTQLVKLEIPDGAIVHIDNFGLMKFRGVLPKLSQGQHITIQVGQQRFVGIYTTRMMSEETGCWAVYPGSSFGLPEIGKVRQNGAQEIGAQIGDLVKIFV